MSKFDDYLWLFRFRAANWLAGLLLIFAKAIGSIDLPWPVVILVFTVTQASLFRPKESWLSLAKKAINGISKRRS